MTLPANAELVPANEAGELHPNIIRDLKGLLIHFGKDNKDLEISRYDIVFNLALLGMRFIGERHNNTINAQNIQEMLDKYSIGGPGAADYYVVMGDVDEEVDTGNVDGNGKPIMKMAKVRRAYRVLNAEAVARRDAAKKAGVVDPQPTIMPMASPLHPQTKEEVAAIKKAHDEGVASEKVHAREIHDGNQQARVDAKGARDAEAGRGRRLGTPLTGAETAANEDARRLAASRQLHQGETDASLANKAAADQRAAGFENDPVAKTMAEGTAQESADRQTEAENRGRVNEPTMNPPGTPPASTPPRQPNRR